MERKDVLKEIEDVMGQEIKQHIGKLNDALNHAHGVLSKDVKEYDRGLNDAWELAKKIACSENYGGLSIAEFREIFPAILPLEVLATFTAQEALAKVKAYEEEIKVGDVLLGKYGGVCVVTKIRDDNTFYGFFDDGSSGAQHKKDFKKTGRCVDIQKIFDEIGVMKNE